jgi:hypothetical protein
MSQTKTTPIYENCTILAPDGQVLCRTKRKKLHWYLDRQLADVEVIRLKFEPSGRRGSNDLFHLSSKDNRCVVCGCDFDLTLHHVVPRCYRKHFPDDMKSHSCHDVVALCSPCHEEYETHAMQYKIEIGKTHDCPIGQSTVDLIKLRVRKAAHALLNHDAVIPEARKNILQNTIYSYLEHEPTRQEMMDLADVDPFQAGRNHAAEVVSQVDPQRFAEQWRAHFLAVMKPEYLPTGWDQNRKER